MAAVEKACQRGPDGLVLKLVPHAHVRDRYGDLLGAELAEPARVPEAGRIAPGSRPEVEKPDCLAMSEVTSTFRAPISTRWSGRWTSMPVSVGAQTVPAASAASRPGAVRAAIHRAMPETG